MSTVHWGDSSADTMPAGRTTFKLTPKSTKMVLQLVQDGPLINRPFWIKKRTGHVLKVIDVVRNDERAQACRIFGCGSVMVDVRDRDGSMGSKHAALWPPHIELSLREIERALLLCWCPGAVPYTADVLLLIGILIIADEPSLYSRR